MAEVWTAPHGNRSCSPSPVVDSIPPKTLMVSHHEVNALLRTLHPAKGVSQQLGTARAGLFIKADRDVVEMRIHRDQLDPPADIACDTHDCYWRRSMSVADHRGNRFSRRALQAIIPAHPFRGLSCESRALSTPLKLRPRVGRTALTLPRRLSDSDLAQVGARALGDGHRLFERRRIHVLFHDGPALISRFRRRASRNASKSTAPFAGSQNMFIPTAFAKGIFSASTFS